MTINEAIQKVIKLANEQVGYKAGKGKITKYSADLDKVGDFYNYKKQGVDWCDIFYDWLMVTAFGAETGRKMIYQPKKSTGAGCGFSANFYRQNNAFGKTPHLGDQIFYGTVGNESHTGIVVALEDKYIYTVEGNTGGGDGQVQKKKIPRSANIAGFGTPNWKLAASEPAFSKQWGIDISEWQYDYNLSKAKTEGVKFVIIRGGGGDNGLYKDARYEENYKKAKDLNLPVGVYWFSKALTVAEAKKEAEFFYKNCLKGKKFELPIYIDVENKTQLRIGKRKLTDVIKAWLDYLAKLDYWVGIYSSLSYFSSYMYDSELTRYAHWVACWAKTCDYKPESCFGMWQFGGESNPIRSNKVAGKVTDQNYMLQDYPTMIKKKGKNGYKANSSVTPAPVVKGLDITGEVDAATTKALQKWVGTYQDGEFSGQLTAQKKYIPSVKTCVFDGGGSAAVKALQNILIRAGYSVGSYGADGYWGENTVKALQRFLNAKIGAKLTVDGVLGKNTATALQKYLNKIVYGV